MPHSYAAICLKILKLSAVVWVLNRVKRVLAMALLAMWLPATSLCLLENAGLISKNDDCPAGQASESSPCCALASATYKMIERPARAIPPPALVIAWFVDPPQLVLPPTLFAVTESGVSPPELPQSWQFSSRAALMPRAPSVS